MVVLSQLGAAVGSIIPGVGNAVGAVAGGAIGVIKAGISVRSKK